MLMMIARITITIYWSNKQQLSSDIQQTTDKQKQAIVNLKSINNNGKGSIGN